METTICTIKRRCFDKEYQFSFNPINKKEVQMQIISLFGDFNI